MIHSLISVVMPCHNDAEYIAQAIRAIIMQTYDNWELLIIDDNSTDTTEKVVKYFVDQDDRIFYYKLPDNDPERFRNGKNINAGWQSRNYGVSKAKGEYITFQDADDGSCSNRLEIQYNLAKKYNVMQVNVDWQLYDDEYNGKRLNYEISDEDIIKTEEILKLTKQTRRGLFYYPFARGEKNFIVNILRKIDRKYIRNWQPYPCAASMPLVHAKVFEKCKFRQLYSRVWPSVRGRGTDRDFNFWVADTFKSSITVRIPLILWRVSKQNENYVADKYRPL